MQNQLLKQAADDFFTLAQNETDNFYRGALTGMRTVFTITEHKGMADYVNLLLLVLGVK